MTRRDILHLAGNVFLVVTWAAASALALFAIMAAAGGEHA